jgi:hypothetical protein
MKVSIICDIACISVYSILFCICTFFNFILLPVWRIKVLISDFNNFRFSPTPSSCGQNYVQSILSWKNGKNLRTVRVKIDRKAIFEL